MVRVVKKPDERRREIIQAARTLFETQAYHKTTMQEIMKTLNIAKGTIYHYFSSKDDLLEAVVEDLIDEELERKKNLLDSKACRNLNALEKMKIMMTTDTMAEKNEQILENIHAQENTRMHSRQLGRYLVKLAPLFAEVIEQGCHEGVFKTDHPLECAEFMLAGVQFLTDVGFYPWENDQLARRASAFPALIESQLNAPKGAFGFLIG